MSAAFDSLLVANRGEVAVRILEACRLLGLRGIAVYADAERHAPHVRAADEAVRLQSPADHRSAEALVAAARRAGAQAVHPGYGFLSEDPRFARACEGAGLRFVGPDPEAIEAMADKIAAKERVRGLGVPVLPGRFVSDAAEAQAVAAELDFPLLFKAAAGGGGRGMRRVDVLSELLHAFEAASREAQQAFSDPRVLLERCVQGARHVEVQVFVDRRGRVSVLGERDCSVQRRYQKVIEEAPCPGLTPDVRARMEEAARIAVGDLKYRGAATVEFLVDERGAFHFLEINTRLQVEHPVTEQVTGLDIVALQIRDALEEDLAELDEVVVSVGHAIEARLYAEDPQRDFAPSPGIIGRWEPPRGPGIRVDAGVHSQSEVLAEFDPMLAKVIAWGHDRDQARRRLVAALERTVVLGVATNRDFLLRVLRSFRFAKGTATTEPDPGLQLAEPGPVFGAVAAAIVAREGGWVRLQRANDPGPREGISKPRHPGPAPRDPSPISFEGDGGAVRTLWVRATGRADEPGAEWHVEEGDRAWAVRWIDENWLEVDGSLRPTDWVCDRAGLHLRWGAETFRVQPPPEARGDRDVAGGSGDRIEAPVTGTVLQVPVSAGQVLAAGQVVAVLESMKMEHRVVAVEAAKVVGVHVRPGQAVQVGTRLVSLAERESA